MIVLDASAAIEFLLATDTGAAVRDRMVAAGTLHAPHLIDPEIVQVMRRKTASGELTAERAAGALEDLGDLRLRRHPHTPLISRAWELRGQVTAYDAMYLALAELLDVPLVTTDERLERAEGHSARLEIVTR